MLNTTTGFRQAAERQAVAICMTKVYSTACNCSFPPKLAGLEAFLNNGRGKGKFLQATEQVLMHEPEVCRAGGRLLDVGAGGGEITRWLAERCNLCAKAYDVKLPDANPYSLLPGSGNGGGNSNSNGSTSEADGRSSPAGGNPMNDGRMDGGGLGRRHFASFRVWHFDGVRVPEASRSFELVVLNSMLHHAAENAPALLREAARVTTRHALIFEDLAVPEDPRIMDRHKIHDEHGIFRTQLQWEGLFADAGFRVDMMGPVGNTILSSLKMQKHAKLDWRHQRFFLLRLGSRRRVPEANVSAALAAQGQPGASAVGKRRCSRVDARFGAIQCHDVSNFSRVNFFYVYL